MDPNLDHDLPTPEEERALIARAQAGDLDARNELIVKNRRLIRRIAAKFFHNGIGIKQELEDLEQWGVFGLIRAIEKFDLSRGLRLSTYSVPWIRASIYRNGMADDNTVSVSYNDTQRMATIRRARADLSQTFNHEPTNQEIADKCGLKTEFVDYALRTVMEGGSSMDNDHPSNKKDPGGNNRGSAKSTDTIDLYEIIPDPNADTAQAGERLAALAEINEAMTILTAAEREIVRRRWYCDPPQTHKRIGLDFGMSYVRIQQIEKSAMLKIKRYLGVNDIDSDDPDRLSR